jgi:hypothetical protein
MIGGMYPDREENRLGTVRGQRLEHCWGPIRPGSVVEREHHLTFAQEIIRALEAKTGPSCGVDLDHARNAEGVRVAGAS